MLRAVTSWLARCSLKTISGHLSVVWKFHRRVLSLGRRSELGIRGEVGFWLDVRLSRSEESLLSVYPYLIILLILLK